MNIHINQEMRQKIKERRARLGYVEVKPVVSMPLKRVSKTSKVNEITTIKLETFKDEEAIEKKIDYSIYTSTNEKKRPPKKALRKYPASKYKNEEPDEQINSASLNTYRMSFALILRSVSIAVDMDADLIMCHSKWHEILQARYMVFWLSKMAGYSLNQIAKRFGFDHTTVLNSIRKFDKHVHEDREYAQIALRLKNELITYRPAPYWGA